MTESRVLMPCPVCHVLPIPKGHAHYGPELMAWNPTKKSLDATSQRD